MVPTEIKMVIVPLWLSQIMGEMGLRDEDLVDMEKLSGILSPRDILIYREINNRGDVMRTLAGSNVDLGLPSCIAAADAVERLPVYDTSTEKLILGATSNAATWNVDVKMVNLDTVMIKLVPATDTPDKTLIGKLGEVLFGRMGLTAFAGSAAGKVWIGSLSS